MSTTTLSGSRRTRPSPLPVLACLVMLAAPAQAQQQAVGRVVFATGNPAAVEADGGRRALARGDDVYAGDTLTTTANGRLQVSFIDGAYISVQPDSQYLIEEYRYSGRPDGTESAIYRLIKGGVRAITGLIGEEKKEAYEVRTPVATIGIRGTGHNTRVCQGDCAGRQDGLYHNTWEGITYVFNNADTAEVPAGRGVFVRDLNTPIRFLSQPPGVTAVDTARDREERQQQEEDQTTVIAAGDQRNDRGDQRIVVGDSGFEPSPSGVLTGQTFIGVTPLSDDGEATVIAGTAASVFSNAAGFVGILSTEQTGDGAVRSVGTIDPGALLGGDDAASAAEAQALLSRADRAGVERFQADPASAVESTVNPLGLAWGRWAGGRVLVVDETGSTSVEELTGHQSIHFIFGPQPASIATAGRAVYEFIGGTRSTTLSGETLGEGVTGGFIGVDLGLGDAFLSMRVSHDATRYTVDGELGIDAARNRLFSAGQGVFASAASEGSACYPDCPVEVNGRFTGPAGDGGVPGNIGIQYLIGETDPVTGVAGFHQFPATASRVESGLELAGFSAFQALNAFTPALGPETEDYAYFDPDGALIGGLARVDFDALDQGLIGDQLLVDGPIETVQSPAGQEPPGGFLVTLDPDAMLGADDNDAVAAAAGILNAADQSVLAEFRQGPARVGENVNDDGIGWGRWTDGRVLAIVDNGEAGVLELVDNQSLHYVYGPEPEFIPGTGTASYGLLGGTRSTSLSGASIGEGVTAGSLSVDFSGTASIYLEVDHAGSYYQVNGPLTLDPGANSLSSVPGSTLATYSSGQFQGETLCGAGCETVIEGRFFGPMDAQQRPGKAGIEYLIQELDPINGAAAFSTAVQPPG